MTRVPAPNEIYRHFKGSLYRILTLAEHTETGERLVIYQALYGTCQVYARPLESFQSRVDHAKYPDVQEEYRFTLLPPFPQEACVSQSPGPASEPEPVPESEPTPVLEPSEPEADGGGQEEEFVLEPRLADFLDADTYREKLEIFAAMQDSITDDILNTLAVSLDLELEPGELEERCQSLKNCLLTLEKYECTRLR